MEKQTSLDEMVNKIKAMPGADSVGMILCHNGIVRGTSRDGRKVRGVAVTADRKKLDDIITAQKSRPGIFEILVHVNEGELKVGDDLLLIAVAGDIRENVIPVLTDTLNTVKKTVTSKTEHFV
ncbi:MAG TPA: molybdenum cofactor biosynthesis protein MoaE [Desulfomonilia bacterium]